MKKLFPILLSSVLLVGVAACSEGARTSGDAPANPNESVETPTQETVQETQEDGQNQTRREQLNSDIRAREQRNDAFGDQQERDDDDLESEVRSKLEANIPGGLLNVAAEEGVVSVTGTVPAEDQVSKIEPLSKEILGVKDVKVDVKVSEGVPEEQLQQQSEEQQSEEAPNQ